MTTDASSRARHKTKCTRAPKPAPGQEHVHSQVNGTAKPTTPERKAPVSYTDEIGEIILQRLRDGESLLAICQSPDLPSESSVREWAADPSHPFSANYTRAREIGYLKMADEVIALSDGIEAGDSKFEPGVVQRHRLMVDSRKWLLSKALPKIYGDRLLAELSGPDGGPVQIEAAAAVRALIEALPALSVLSPANGELVDGIALAPAALPAALDEPAVVSVDAEIMPPPAVAASEAPRPLPTSLQAGEREICANGAEISYSPEFRKYAVHDHAGRLHGYRGSLDAARDLARNIPAPAQPRVRKAEPEEPRGVSLYPGGGA